MGVFDRMKVSWFKPTAEPQRTPRVTFRPEKELPPAIDEKTAEAAAQILENDAFRLVMGRLKSQVYADFANTNKTFDLPEIHTRLRALEEIEQQIGSMADDLKIRRRQTVA